MKLSYGIPKVDCIAITFTPAPWDSILLAVFTVSPNKQYLGIFNPTTPATTEPVA